jgi:hypothetical protein
MSLRYKYKKANEIVGKLLPQERESYLAICNEIKNAQEMLLTNGKAAMKKCIYGCGGLCCQNIYPDEIISLWDVVYILSNGDGLHEKITQCIQKENALFTSKCIFLENDAGPCIFPNALRPEVCITTFCSGDSTIKKEIRTVKLKFFKLYCFFLLNKLKRPKRLSKVIISACLRSK